MTLLGWMLQATVLGALFGAAAVLLEPVMVRRRRWVWVAAALLSGAAPLLALLAPSLWPGWSRWRVTPALPVADGALGAGAAVRTASGSDAGLDPVLIAWTVLTLLCLTRYVTGWVRLWLLSRGCVRVRLGGRELLLSDRLGPAVVGLWRPRVVAPPWIVAVSAAWQRMIVMHEAEHVRARDHWLLAAAPLLTVLMPWNVAQWWQLWRLRLAVELDCDARVLARGVRPLDYGGLLLDVAGGASAPAVPALAEPRSLLERRLEAVVGLQRRPGAGRCSALAVAAVVAVLAGCLAGAPVRVVARSPAVPVVSAADSSGADSGATTGTTEPVATVQQGEASERGADTAGTKANVASSIARVPLGIVVPLTSSAPVPDAAPARTRAEAVTDTDAPRPLPVDSARNATRRARAPSAGEEPLFVIDGVIVPGGFAAVGLEPADIDRIQVLKGAAAAAQYGPLGARGVVAITTRHGGAGR